MSHAGAGGDGTTRVRAIRPTEDAWCVLLYISIAIATGFADLRMRPHTLTVTKYITGVVDGSEYAPGKYRVLAPFIIDGLADASGVSLEATWYGTRLLFIFLAYLALHAYLRTWFPPRIALAGVALTAATLPLTITNSWPHPDSMPELALFSLGAMAIARRNDGLFAIVLALAALNRETSAFLVALYFVAFPVTRDRLTRTLFLGFEWLTIYAGLRILRGVQHYDYWQAGRNLADLALLPANYDPYYRGYAYFAIVLFGPLLALALRERAKLPSFARRALLVVPCFVAVAFTFSSIIESRIFLPLYPLVLPAFMFAVFGDHGHASASAERIAELEKIDKEV
jgi:hypothetical protein